jgi:phosphoribosylaminoimidazolecarboxamide formyltransferase / IMP cyclohydrolase
MAINVVEKIDEKVKVNNVLISVADKTGLESFVPGLVAINPDIKIYSTGGTYKKIKEILKEQAHTVLSEVSEYTGQPEMQGGLVKTLDFKIYLGLLSETYNDAHTKDLNRTHAVPIDMIVSNLYPFKETIAKPGSTPENARGNIDIGGPCMVRASAKNFLRVASVTEPGDYDLIIGELKYTGGCLTLKTRYKLAVKAFTHTAHYDKAISEYFSSVSFKEIKDCYHIAE